jgi:adenylate cyclase, class 2
MPSNLELKIKLKSFQQIEDLLTGHKVQFRGMLKQKDIYFKVKSGLLKLRIEHGTYTLIRYLRDEKGKRWSNYELLYLHGKDPEKYLRHLFDIETIVEKRRKLYLWKDTRIHLDNVKGLGKFLELETLLVSTKKNAFEQFNELKMFLKIDKYKQIRKSYKNLVDNK